MQDAIPSASLDREPSDILEPTSKRPTQAPHGLAQSESLEPTLIGEVGSPPREKQVAPMLFGCPTDDVDRQARHNGDEESELTSDADSGQKAKHAASQGRWKGAVWLR